MSNVLGMQCPHCASRALVRSSTAVSPTLRQVYFQCPNLLCGHTWVAHLEAVRTISPSSMPNPTVTLPVMRTDDVHALDAVLRPSPQRSLFHESDLTADVS